MCGRYIQVSSPTLLVEQFNVDEVVIEETPEADYNVAPRKEVLTIVQREAPRTIGRDRGRPAGSGSSSRCAGAWCRRGPRTPKIGDRMINARAESLTEKAAFKTAFRKRRCIIPADGFYEWQRFEGTKKKQPMFIHRRDGEPIGFAGLWEVWREDPDVPWLLSCTIVTTRANAMMEPIHDRMPVMLPETGWQTVARCARRRPRRSSIRCSCLHRTRRSRCGPSARW